MISIFQDALSELGLLSSSRRTDATTRKKSQLLKQQPNPPNEQVLQPIILINPAPSATRESRKLQKRLTRIERKMMRIGLTPPPTSTATVAPAFILSGKALQTAQPISLARAAPTQPIFPARVAPTPPGGCCSEKKIKLSKEERKRQRNIRRLQSKHAKLVQKLGPTSPTVQQLYLPVVPSASTSAAVSIQPILQPRHAAYTPQHPITPIQQRPPPASSRQVSRRPQALPTPAAQIPVSVYAVPAEPMPPSQRNNRPLPMVPGEEDTLPAYSAQVLPGHQQVS
ncbi:hypothetical protein HDU67_002265 [Dinochytrium kinnereticum]|nr:hypothetical protein HDU67_002265 [Dinochytrium kinnereticum]